MKTILQSTVILRAMALLALFAISSGVSAHTALKESTPAADATVTAAPSKISLVFNGPVRLVKMELMASGQAVPTKFKPSADAVASFDIETPAVAAGSYTVNWAAIGADGHTVSNSFSFVVNSSANSAP